NKNTISIACTIIILVASPIYYHCLFKLEPKDNEVSVK
ncbi:unnamed protein product, partial [marine sediment metagenome]